MLVYNLKKYSHNYPKTSGSLSQYYRHETIAALVNSELFKSKIKITEKIAAAGNTKDVEIAVPLKYLRDFWKTLEMPLIICETNLMLTWSKDCAISSATGETKFAIEDVPVVTLSIQDKAKVLLQLLQQHKSGFKRIINWNKYQ